MSGFNSILKSFLPKDRVFYQLFEVVAEELVKMGVALKEVVNEPDFEKRAALIKKIEDMEHVNDDHTHQIFTELSRNPWMILQIIFMPLPKKLIFTGLTPTILAYKNLPTLFAWVACRYTKP